ncbi:MAG: fumarylacetoacetate hydrolase family protein [Xanthomonadales bacterium]|nr:fumarylacetoacetate hydrolase family protein [Xanthomonadales bacterium]
MNHIQLHSAQQSSTATPTKLVCLGRNYAAHAKELNNPVPTTPVIFLKPNSCISQQLILPKDEHEVHYETELCFMVKDNKLHAVGVGLDLTKRNLQQQLKSQGLPWEQAKCFDGAAVLSHFIPLAECIETSLDAHTFSISLHVNGRLAQEGNNHDMLTQPEAFLAAALTFMSLEDGDILMTGTPKGVGPVHSGDELVARVYRDEQLLIQCEWKAK